MRALPAVILLALAAACGSEAESSTAERAHWCDEAERTMILLSEDDPGQPNPALERQFETLALIDAPSEIEDEIRIIGGGRPRVGDFDSGQEWEAAQIRFFEALDRAEVYVRDVCGIAAELVE